MQFGFLLPHFGAHASPDRCVRLAARAEELGFDSLWVRDHLVWTPHGFEGTDPTFIDPFVALSAAAVATTRVMLGTAVVIPTRWPLKLAQECASLSWLSGGRVICGIGLGYLRQEFEATGLDYTRREAICKETIDILRLVWGSDHASYAGEVFSFEDITLRPKPAAPIPIEYGGSTPAGMRRAMEWSDGWQGARLPLKTLDRRLELRKRLEDASGKRIKVSMQPLVTIANSEAEAVARVPIGEMGPSRDAAKWWDYPPSGRFETLRDLEGLNIAGTPEQVAEKVRKFADRDVQEFILDLRLQFDDVEQALELFGTQVLPAFR